MSLSVRTRFEIFKRDRFTCAYCGRWPDQQTVRVLLRRLPLEAIYEAIDITAGRFPNKASYDSTKYFYGVCWRMVKGRELR